jgi:protein-tyrosine phosphatase
VARLPLAQDDVRIPSVQGTPFTVIDLHLHILADVDDGPSDRDTSLAMLDLAASFGYSTLVATPHFPDPVGANWERVRTEAAWLAEVAMDRGITLLQGYEVRIHLGLAQWLDGEIPMTLGQSGTVLIELPFVGWPTFTEQVLFEVIARGYRVLLAHPERYEAVINDPDLLQPLRDRGVLMQLTTGSLAGLFGRRSQALGELMLRNGWVDVLASDAHSAGRRFVAVGDGLAKARELVGDEMVDRLTTENPAAILADQPVALMEPPPGTDSDSGWRQSLSRVRAMIPRR